MEFVAIKEMANGNETVGTMWQETKIFPADATIADVMKWVGVKTQVTLTIPENYQEEFAELPF